MALVRSVRLSSDCWLWGSIVNYFVSAVGRSAFARLLLICTLSTFPLITEAQELRTAAIVPARASPGWDASEIRDSVVSMNFSVATSTVADTIDLLFASYREVGPVKNCHDSEAGRWCTYSYDLSILRDGRTSVEIRADAIEVRIPAKVEGDVLIHEHIAQNTQVAPLTGTFEAILRARPSIGTDWCIDLKVDPKIVWHKRPRISIAGLITFEAHQEIEKGLLQVLSQEQLAELNVALCKQVRDIAQGMWRLHSIPVATPAGDVYMNIKPISLGYAGPTWKEKSLDIGLFLRGKAFLTTGQIVEQAAELPPLQKMKVVKGSVFLQVPLLVSLRDIKREAGVVVAQIDPRLPFALRGASLRFGDIEPSITGNRVRLAIDFKVEHAWSPFALHGRAIVTGEPRVDGKQHLIALDAVETDIELDSSVVSAALRPFLPTLKRELRQKISSIAHYKVKPDFDKRLQEIKEAAEKFEVLSGVGLKMDRISFALSHLTLRSDGVEVYASAFSTIDAEIKKVNTRVLPMPAGGLFTGRYRAVNFQGRSKLDLTRGPKSGPIVMSVVRGESQLELLTCEFVKGERHKWCQVRLRDKKGWINQYHLSPARLG
jgi:hypothetical protein